MKYYMINLLEHNCSIITIIIALKAIVTKIVGKIHTADNLN
jgi:hypothetical protein